MPRLKAGTVSGSSPLTSLTEPICTCRVQAAADLTKKSEFAKGGGKAERVKIWILVVASSSDQQRGMKGKLSVVRATSRRRSQFLGCTAF